MARFLRAGVAIFVAWSGVLACQSIIGADFGNYRVDEPERGGAGGNAANGPGGASGNGMSGGTGAAPGGGASGSSGEAGQAGSAASGGTTSTGGTSSGGDGGVGADGGSAGDTTGPPRVLAVTGGQLHTCAILESGTLKCWGNAFYGQIGTDDNNNVGDMFGEMGDTLQPVPVGANRRVKYVAAGRRHTCVILEDGAVRCWGSNEHGNLGLGLGTLERQGDDAGEMAALTDVNLGAGRTALAIAAGQDHTCVVLDDGSLKCWGGNTSGCLGLGTTEANVGD